MQELPDNSVDLTVTSPPYDNLRTYEDEVRWDWEIFTGVADHLYKVTADGGVVVWIVGDATINGSETGTSFRQALYFKEIGFNLHDTMIYEKTNPAPTGGVNRYFSSFEYMFVFSKGAPKTFNPILVPRSNKWNDKRESRNKNYVRDKSGNFSTKEVKLNLDRPVKMKNIWKAVVGGGNSTRDDYAFEHPAILPEVIAEQHILSWTDEGDTVFDPFMGSGTTGKMALKHSRNFLGSEIVYKYYEISTKRLKGMQTFNDLVDM
jgi:site-specific DNA-methyltransferase (adenine-specific)